MGVGADVKTLDRNIYLTGFMGSGKSVKGRTLAGVMKRRFVDMDDELERSFGMPISEVFIHHGEPAFRKAETKLLKRLARRKRLVVATGGGVPATPENVAAMRRSGTVIYLSVPLGEIRARLTTEDIRRRPLWEDERAVEALYERRQSAYAQCDAVVDGGLEAVAVAARILDMYAGCSPLAARHGEVTCPVVPTFDAAGDLATRIFGRRVALLTDRNVARHHLERYRDALGQLTDIVVPPGEKSKSLRGAGVVYEALLGAQFGRDDVLVALGGGMITDLGAFVASTYKRGMDFVLVSTSLLGCVDAAVGGKAAVNFGAAKNQVGLFTVPLASLLDLRALGTLPRRQVDEGLVEAYKTGLIWDTDLGALIEENLSILHKRDLAWIAEVGALSAKAKAQVVSEDFRENGLRRILNFGHTYGHAVEGWHGYRVRHGQCVAAGMLVASELSCRRGLIGRDWADRIAATLLQMVPRGFALPDVADAWPIMVNDKKNRGGRVVFVLLAGPAQCTCVEDVTPEELDQALSKVRQKWHE